MPICSDCNKIVLASDEKWCFLCGRSFCLKCCKYRLNSQCAICPNGFCWDCYKQTLPAHMIIFDQASRIQCRDCRKYIHPLCAEPHKIGDYFYCLVCYNKNMTMRRSQSDEHINTRYKLTLANRSVPELPLINQLPSTKSSPPSTKSSPRSPPSPRSSISRTPTPISSIPPSPHRHTIPPESHRPKTFKPIKTSRVKNK